MVDSDQFITGGSIDFKALASRLVSSYVLAVLSGLTAFVYAVLETPALLLEDLFTWVANTLGLGFQVPENTLTTAWSVVAGYFPVAGPLDFALGVVAVLAFFWALNWMFGRIMEGLQ